MNEGLEKPAWCEGALMTPQHFQRQDRYHERLLAARLRATVHYDWGITCLSIDGEALSRRTLRLRQLAGVWPDGEVLCCGDGQAVAAPPPRGFEEALGPRGSLAVFVALPEDRVAGRRIWAGDAQDPEIDCRYDLQTREVVDEVGQAEPQPVPWARPRPRILFGEEAQGSACKIQIAELVRSSAGDVMIRDTFVPPTLHLDAAPFVQSGLARLASAVSAGVRDLPATASGGGGGRRAALLIWLSAFSARLDHLVATTNAHPEEAYVLLAELASVLSCFATAAGGGAGACRLPKFDYLALGEVFEEVFAKTISLLSQAAREGFEPVPLERRADGVYVGELSGERRGHWLVAVHSRVEPATLHDRVPRVLKIAEWRCIYETVKHSRAGVRCEPVWRSAEPREALPPGCLFEIQPRGEAWDKIAKSGVIALYLPSEGVWASARLELYFVAADPGARAPAVGGNRRAPRPVLVGGSS